jgi:quercetin dioxygenase-like cupin family protein
MQIQGKVWGFTSPLFNKNNTEVHLIHAKKGGYCSKHYHKSKYNQFLVLHGKLKITVWKEYGNETLEDITILEKGMECTVSPGDFHRFEVLEDTQALEIYWVELKDNDIVRADHGGVRNETKTNASDAIESYRKEDRKPILGTFKGCSHPGCGVICNERTTTLW